MKNKKEVPFSLLDKTPQKKWKTSQKVGYRCWNIGWLVLACIVLGLACLLLSAANYGMEVFGGYFEMPMIAFVNILLQIAFALVLFLLTGRAWIAYGITMVLSLGLSLANYFLIGIRTDPLQFMDVLCLREALDITATQHYELHIGWEVILTVSSCLAFGVVLFFQARWTPKIKERFGLLCGTVPVVVLACILTSNSWVNSVAMRNYEHINTWSSTEIYISRGFPYSFTRSAINSIRSAPGGYDKKQAAAELAQYEDADIPADKKVNVIAIMRESYCDLSALESTEGAIDFSCYDYYHSLQAESYTGVLLTNGFGGNTKDAERCFLTGSFSPIEYRKPANSYVWYLREQGYTAEGAHPFNGWFYNRANINRYLGFETYNFREEVFDDLVGTERVADDDVLYDEIWRMFDESDPDKPYFNFSVTYEGHGPYSYQRNKYATRFVKSGVSTADGYSMNNYLSCVYKRDQELADLVERLRASDRPVVLLTFGDHKPTLGADINNYSTAAYTTYGMDMDVSSEEGFIDYYGTEYLIWANDAAKEALGIDLAGQTGPMISPCYLMNVLFDALGWGDGSAYMQAMDTYMDEFPIVSTKGRISANGTLVQDVPADLAGDYNRFVYLDYYWKRMSK